MTIKAPPSGVVGMTTAEVTFRLQRDGPNTVPPPRRTPAWRHLLAQMTHFFAAMLWVAAALAILAGMASLAVAIVIIVILNGFFAFAQEHKADRAASELNSMIPTSARVRRDGEILTVDAADLVSDDLVFVEAGDRIGADLRISDSHDLTVGESMLTGESVPVRRGDGSEVFTGTFAVQGDATGVVVATGTRTRLSGIAALTEQARRPPSPLAVQLHKLVLVVAVLAVTVGLLVGVTSLA